MFIVETIYVTRTEITGEICQRFLILCMYIFKFIFKEDEEEMFPSVLLG